VQDASSLLGLTVGLEGIETTRAVPELSLGSEKIPAPTVLTALARATTSSPRTKLKGEAVRLLRETSHVVLDPSQSATAEKVT